MFDTLNLECGLLKPVALALMLLSQDLVTFNTPKQRTMDKLVRFSESFTIDDQDPCRTPKTFAKYLICPTMVSVNVGRVRTLAYKECEHKPARTSTHIMSLRFPSRFNHDVISKYLFSVSIIYATRSSSIASPCRSNRSCQSRYLIDQSHSFSTTSITQKKGAKLEKERARAAASSDSSGSTPAIDDPADFSTLKTSIETTLTNLKNDLSKLRTGGRFNPELLENVRVQLSKDSKKMIKLGELAQVVPKGGRSINILVGEKDVRCFRLSPVLSCMV